jgi:hypothetical protein
MTVQLKSMHAQSASSSATITIDPVSVTNYFCVVRPSVLENYRRTNQGPVADVLSTTAGAKMWEEIIGSAPKPTQVSVLHFETDASRDMEPPLRSLGLLRHSIRDCRHSLFLRTTEVRVDSNREQVILGIAYKDRTGERTITNGTEPAEFVSTETAPIHPKWQFWRK